jgi:hypothetical protein
MNGSGLKLGAFLAVTLVAGQIVTGQVAHATPAMQSVAPPVIAAAAPNSPPVEIKQQIYESYKINKEITIDVLRVDHVKSKQAPAAPVITSVRLTKDMELTVLEADSDPKFGDIIRIGTDSDNALIPSDFWVRANDLLKAGLEQSEMSFDNVDPVLSEQDLGSDPVLGERELSGANDLTLFANTRAMYPFRYVKQYLLRAGIVTEYLPGSSPTRAANVLVQFGFRKTKRTASNAHLRDVCVYGVGNSGNGHIELKLKEGWWYGYGFHGAVTLKNSQLIGCYSKAVEKNSRLSPAAASFVAPGSAPHKR